jgi:hypothetical protein
MEQRLGHFLTSLLNEETNLNQKLRFTKEHNFNVEAQHIETKLQIIREIRSELKSVFDGTNKTGKVDKWFFE